MKQICNNQIPEVKLFTAFITDLLYVNGLSLSKLSPNIRLSTDKNIETKDRGKRRQDRKDSSSNLVLSRYKNRLLVLCTDIQLVKDLTPLHL